jgi:acyl dehydratase
MIGDAQQARRVEPGQLVATERHAPITRVEIAWYMVASYDHNPIHVDEPFARAAGFGSVIGQGMLPLGFLARRLVQTVGLQRIRSLAGDFVGPVLPGDELVTELRVLARHERPGGVEIEWELGAADTDGKPRLRGRAVTWHENEERERT